MALLGQGYRPELGIYDYSAITRANEMMGQATANLGQQVGDGIADYQKERKDLSARVKAGDFMLKYAELTNPDQKDQFAALRNEMANPNLSKSDQAAMADSISGMIALGTANDRFAKEFGMRGQELALRQREASELSKARQFDISTAQTKQDAQRIVAESVGPAKLQAAIDMAKKNRPEILQSMPDIGAMTPDMQGQIADQIVQLLPEKVKRELKNIPATIDGQSVELPVFVDPYGGMEPVQLDGSVLPPKPGGENATPEELAAGTPTPQVTLGRSIVSPQDQKIKELQIEKAKQEIVAGEQTKTETTDAKTAAMAAKDRTLKIIEKYMTSNGKPTETLSSSVGFGEGVSSWMGNIPFIPGGNTGETIANQKELQLNLLENSILEASKALKPVSVDELKFLKANRPAITDKAEVWTQYMKSIKDVIGNPANYKTDSPTSAANPSNNSLLNAWQTRPR